MPKFQQMPKKTGMSPKPKSQQFIRLQMALALQKVRCGTLRRSNMTLKIERQSDGRSTTIRLIGRMRAEHLEELDTQIRECGSKIALDLEEVNLVDVEVVRFLGICEAQGVTLLNCSPYISDWVVKERQRKN
jgi:hypothetical protein